MTSGVAWSHLDPIKRAQLLHFYPELRAEIQRYEKGLDEKREADMDEQRLNEKEKENGD